jgi:O-antigen/teichoic acid export membrane protein
VPEEFGRASMFTLVYNVALLFSLLGLDQSFVRYYYEKQDKSETFWNCLIPSVVFGMGISVIFILFERPLSVVLYGKHYRWIGLLFALSLLTGILQRYNQLSIRMQKKGILFSTLDIISSLGNFGGTVLFVLTLSGSFYAIVLGQIVGNISALIAGFLADRSSRKFAKLNINLLRIFLKYGLPFVPSSLLYWLFSSIDRISLRQYSTFTEIGLYSAAFKIVSVMQLLQSGFTTFWIPVAYEKYELNNDSKEFFKKANTMVSAILFVAGIFVLGFKDLIFLLFAKSYREASYIAPFLILYPIMYTISETTALGINFSKKTYWHIVITGVSAFVNLVGNTMLVPLLGARGAAISTGLSYIIFFTLRTVIAQRYYSVDFDLKRIYVCTFLTVVVAAAGTFLRNPLIYGFLCALAMAVVFLVYKDAFTYVKKQIKKE